MFSKDHYASGNRENGRYFDRGSQYSQSDKNEATDTNKYNRAVRLADKPPLMKEANTETSKEFVINDQGYSADVLRIK